jgi:hypothetical protein
LTVYEFLQKQIAGRKLRGLARLDAQSALKRIQRFVEGAEMPGSVDDKVGRVIEVPGDEASWVVFAEWEDGSVDCIREQGAFPEDVLVGYRLGQSYQSYKAELTEEFPDVRYQPEPGTVFRGAKEGDPAGTGDDPP